MGVRGVREASSRFFFINRNVRSTKYRVFGDGGKWKVETLITLNH